MSSHQSRGMLLQGLFGKLTEKLTCQAEETTEALIARQQVNAGQIDQAPALILMLLKEQIDLPAVGFSTCS